MREIAFSALAIPKAVVKHPPLFGPSGLNTMNGAIGRNGGMGPEGVLGLGVDVRVRSAAHAVTARSVIVSAVVAGVGGGGSERRCEMGHGGWHCTLQEEAAAPQDGRAGSQTPGTAAQARGIHGEQFLHHWNRYSTRPLGRGHVSAHPCCSVPAAGMDTTHVYLTGGGGGLWREGRIDDVRFTICEMGCQPL